MVHGNGVLWRASRAIGVAAFLAAAMLLQGCERPEAAAMADEPATQQVAMAQTAAHAAPPSAPAPGSGERARALPSAEAISDPAISARIAESLRADPAMAGSDVSVNTDHGVVSLAGRVRSTEQAAIATGHAQRPDGVMRIESHLALEAG